MEQVKLKVFIAERLYKLPKKMNMYRSSNVLPECVLWELSHELCLHLKYAAYFVYNPDFYLCKGVAGVMRDEIKEWHEHEPWHNMDQFESSIKESSFNKNVRLIMLNTQPHDSPESVAHTLQKTVQLDNPVHTIWHLKNDNLGILLHESYEQNREEEEIENAVEYLSFCPF